MYIIQNIRTKKWISKTGTTENFLNARKFKTRTLAQVYKIAYRLNEIELFELKIHCDKVEW